MDGSVWHNLAITLLGTLAGVLIAFRLDRAWERRQSKQIYGCQLDACRYDLANLRSLCGKIRDQVAVGSTNILEIKAPGLKALLASPNLHEHGTHGFIVALTSLSGFIAASRNMISHYRTAAAMGHGLTDQGVVDTGNRMTELMRVVEYVQTLIDGELQRLCLGVARTPHDAQVLDEMAKALRGEGSRKEE